MSAGLKRNLKRTGIALLALLLLLVVLVAGIASWLLGTAGGGRWLVDQVPGLTVTGFDGRLAGKWRAQSLEWASGGVQLNAEDLAMAWSVGCLWDREICLERVRVGAIDLQIEPGEDEEPPSDEPISLPEIDLPVRVTLDQLSLGRFTFNDTLVLQDVELAAAVAGSDLEIENLSLAREDLKLKVTGDVTMAADWPLDARVEYRMPLLEDQHLEVRLNARGRVARNIHLDAEIDGYLAATLSGMVQPLAPGVPAELTAKPTRLPLPEDLPATLHPETIEIMVVGNLDDGWNVEASARLPADGEPMRLELAGHATTADVRIDRLLLNADSERYLSVEGRLDWSDAPTAEANLSWRDFPWERLLPDMGPLPVSLQTLDAGVSYADDAYNGQVDARFDGPVGPSTLSTPFRGDLGRISLPELSVTAGPGGIEGAVVVDFADALGWQADLSVQALDPGYWVEDLPGRLDGTVQSEGRLTDAGPDLTASVDLNGRLRDQDARISVEAQARQGQWHADPLNLQLGDNRISGNAAQGEDDLSANLDIDLAQLDQLWPGLAGALIGEISASAGEISTKAGGVNASGLPANLNASANLSGENLSYADMSIASLAVNAGLDRDSFSLDTDVQGIEIAEQRIEQVRLDGSGTLAEHQLRIRADEARGSVDLTFTGGSETLELPLADSAPVAEPAASDATGPAAVWAGYLSAGEVTIVDQSWRLRSPAPLAYRENGEATLGAHCWGWADTSLCAQDQRLWPDPRIRLALDNLPSSLTDPFMPPGVRWIGTVNALVELDMDANGPRGQASIDAGPGQLNVLEVLDEDEADAEPDWIEYPYDILRLTADLDPDQMVANVVLSGPNLGELKAQATIDDPTGETRPLNGSFSLDSLDLAVARPFAQLQELAGTVSGSAEIGGTLTEPTVEGQIALTNGQVADARLPLYFEDLGLQVQFTETGAELEGGWRSGDEGRGNIAGEARWGGTPNANIRITGERLPARLEPFAQVEIAPDLTVDYNGEKLSIAGEVAIPRGAVEIRELPPQAVSVSDDAVIVGEEQEEAEPASPVENLSMQLDIIVGEDELTFDGFGVTGNLDGRLRIGDNLDTRGELSLRDGEYEIYGQQLELRQANLLFAGPISQPFLEIEAIRQVGNVTAGIRLTGPAERPVTEVFSEPPMAEEQALSYLILGRPLQSQQDNSVVGTAALSIGLNQAAPLTRAVGERIGVQDLQLDAEGSGDEQRITASGYLTEKLSIRYGVSLFDTANKLALRYDLTKQLYLEAASGVASSLDIFYSRDFW